MVIGGGISGISFSYYLNRSNKKVLLLEKEARAGGQVQTQSAKIFDFWYDLGAHTCYNSYISLLSIVKELNLDAHVQPMGQFSYLVYKQNDLKNMMAGFSWPSMILNCPKIFFASKEGKTVEEYFGKIVGKTNYEQFFSKAFRAVLSQNANNYPAEIFLKKRKSRFEAFPRKYTFTNGISSLTDAIIEKSGLEIKTNSAVKTISRTGDDSSPLYEIEIISGQKFYASAVALAIDPASASVLLQEIEPDLSKLLATIPIAHSESIGVVLPKEKVNVKKMAGIIPVSDQFLSVVSRDLVEHPAYRGFVFHFEKGKLKRNEQLDTICKVLNIKIEDIVTQTFTEHVLPSLRVQHIDLKTQIEKVKINSGIFILGNYFNGLSMEDCVQRSQDEFRRYSLLY
jgi:protoporphyrinogen oxidase